jgi:hypothetical protein
VTGFPEFPNTMAHRRRAADCLVRIVRSKWRQVGWPWRSYTAIVLSMDNELDRFVEMRAGAFIFFFLPHLSGTMRPPADHSNGHMLYLVPCNDHVEGLDHGPSILGIKSLNFGTAFFGTHAVTVVWYARPTMPKEKSSISDKVMQTQHAPCSYHSYFIHNSLRLEQIQHIRYIV